MNTRVRETLSDTAANADERVYGEWRDQEWPVLFHIKGEDVVLEGKDGTFISILRGGASNAWTMHFRRGKI